MALNESSRKPRDRWPLKFDLEAIPRDSIIRKQLLEQKEAKNMPELVKNHFAVDYVPAETVVDINNPPHKRYVHQEFPKMLYPADYQTGGKPIVVQDKDQMEKMLKKKYLLKPPPRIDPEEQSA